jgi:hypothetical protein
MPERVAAVASIHGAWLVKDTDDSPHIGLDTVTAEVYLGWADNDATAPPETVPVMEAALKAAGVNYTLDWITDAVHGYAPHVAYLGTVLSEMRDRTWVGDGGQKHDGGEMIDRIWTNALRDSTGVGRQQFLDMTMAEIDHAVEGRTDRDDLLDEFFSIGHVRRGDDGQWTDDSDQRLVNLETEGSPA